MGRPNQQSMCLYLLLYYYVFILENIIHVYYQYRECASNDIVIRTYT